MNRDQIEDSPLSLCLLDGEGEEKETHTSHQSVTTDDP